MYATRLIFLAFLVCLTWTFILTEEGRLERILTPLVNSGKISPKEVDEALTKDTHRKILFEFI